MLAHKVNEDARLFFFEVKYPEEYGVWYPTYDQDIEYLKSRILTYRSAHTTEMDMETSQYYEGAKTLIEVFDLFMATGIATICKDMNVLIENIKEPEHFDHAEVQFHMICDQTQVDDSGKMTSSAKGDYKITLIYTRETNNPCGIFLIYGENLDNGNTFTVGDTLVSKIGLTTDHLNWLDEGAKCFPAGPILKYSENFPIYATLANQIMDRLKDTLDIIVYD